MFASVFIGKNQRSREDLKAFLERCQVQAKAKGRMQIASVSLRVKHIDPLAVLQSIYESKEEHFYLEHPSAEEAIAGAEAVIGASFEGPERFNQVKAFTEEVLKNTIVATDSEDSPRAGPHFFVSFTFFDKKETKASPFEPARVFLPRWQVSRKNGIYTAVANIPVNPDSEIEPLVAKIWGAHQKFNAFDYNPAPKGKNICSEYIVIKEVGGPGWYESAIQKGLEGIEKDDYQKIVLARALDLESSQPMDPLGSLNRLRNNYPHCYPCSIANGKGQSFIAAAPERLLKVEAGKLTTEALAGSTPRGGGAQEDAQLGLSLLNSEKDLREHRIVIDSILENLAEIGIHANIPENPKIKQLANVQHICTPIGADLPKGIHILDIAQRLHPTPAVGGFPKKSAMRVIAEIENFDRGLYAGAIGYYNAQGDGELVVGIRSALIDGKRARIYAGCGIVAGSNPKTERAETDLKAQAMLSNLE